MKFRKLLGGGLLAAVLALGGVAGLATHSESKSVSAGIESGVISIDMTGYWAESNECKLAMYFFDDNAGKNTWSDLFYFKTGTKYAELAYDIDFVPANMIAVRFSKDVTTADWNQGDNKWNQTQNLDYVKNGNIIITGHNYGHVGTAYVSSDKSSWGNKANLSGKKINEAGHIEYYSDNINFVDNEFFKIVRANDWYGDNFVELSPFVEDDFEINSEGSDDNIKCLVGGTYSIYFDYEAKHIYINDPVAAAADAWAQQFLKGVTCDGDGSITKDEWSTLSGSYAVLDGDVKEVFEKIPLHGKDEGGTYAEKAVCRYDYIIIKYGIGASAPKHTDFMGRFGENGINKNVPTAQAPISVFGSMDNSTPIMLVVIISIVSLTAVGGYIFLKRRKED